MNSKKLFLLMLIVPYFAVFAIPDNAIDFTVNDANGVSHTLFTYLNAGKYALLEFAQSSST